MRILVVDDEATSRMIMQAMLMSLGKVDIVENGEKAVESFQEALRADEPYDLICLDVEMPGMGGRCALSKIREVEQQAAISGKAKVTIIMTTSHDNPSDVFGAINRGCNAYLSKPIKRSVMMEQLRELKLAA